MKVYAINLERAAERRAHIVNQLEKHRLDYELVSGVDGKKLSDAELERMSDRAAVTAKPEKLTVGAIGCALSHLKVYRKMLADDVEIALILEDDAVLFDGIGEMLAAIETKIEPQQAILLHYFKVRPEKVKLSRRQGTRLDEKHALLQPINFPHSGTAYVITKETARGLAETKLPVRVEADDWGNFVETGAVESVRCVYPKPLIVSHSKTQIQPIKPYREMTRTRQKIYRYISENQIPILYRMVCKFSEFRERYGQSIVLVDEPAPVSASNNLLKTRET